MKNIIKIAITGAYGRMGSSLIKTIQKYKNIKLACVIVKKKKKDLFNIKEKKIKIYENIKETIHLFDILIDFTNPQSTLKNLQICEKYKKNIVIGTTGFKKQEYNIIKEHSKKISIVLSSNFSIGINLIFKLLKYTSKILNDSYDVEILESHHRNKIDSPSGTALSIGKIIAKNKKWNFEKCSIYRKKEITNIRKKNQIGFSIIRGGNIIGKHKIMFLGSEENIIISHQANSRNTFSDGAIKAAIWLKNKKKGLFNMKHILKI